MENTTETTNQAVLTFLKNNGFETKHGARVMSRLSQLVNDNNVGLFTEKAAKCVYIICLEPRIDFAPEATRSHKVMSYRRAKRSFELIKDAFNLRGIDAFNNVCSHITGSHIAALGPASLRDAIVRIYSQQTF